MKTTFTDYAIRLTENTYYGETDDGRAIVVTHPGDAVLFKTPEQAWGENVAISGTIVDIVIEVKEHQA